MRSVLILSLLAGCSLFNAPGGLDTETDCADGLDNDSNGAADCADTECVTRFECFELVSLSRDPQCPPRAPGIALSDPFFPYLDASVWQSDHEPLVPTPQGIRLQNTSQSLTLREPLRFGAGTAFTLKLDVDVEGNPVASPVIGMEVSLLDGEREVVHLDLAYSLQLEAQVRIHCELRDGSRALPEGASLRPGRIEIEASMPEGSHILTILANGAEVCHLGPVEVEELPVRLRMRGSSRLLGPDGVQLTKVQLHVGEQKTLLDACRGIHEPVLGACAEGGVEDFFFDGKAVHAPDGYHLFWPQGHARSADGRTGWVRDALTGSLQRPQFDAVIYDAGGRRFLAWAQALGPDFSIVRRMLSAPLDQPTLWSVVGSVTRDGQPWLPRGVEQRPDRFIGVEMASDKITGATSVDGLSWTTTGTVLEASRGWDRRFKRWASLHWTGEYFLLAYVAATLEDDDRIGIAASADGVHWTRHPSNPVFVGGDEQFDDVGVNAPTVLLESKVIRLWYTGVGSSPDPMLVFRHERPCADSGTVSAMTANLELVPAP